jgi:hypothetical protein
VIGILLCEEVTNLSLFGKKIADSYRIWWLSHFDYNWHNADTFAPLSSSCQSHSAWDAGQTFKSSKEGIKAGLSRLTVTKNDS